MYGLIIGNIATFLRTKYGEATWTEIKYVAGIEQDKWDGVEVCSEGLVYKLIWAAQDITGDGSDVILEAIGYSFYDYLSQFEYNKVVRVVGRTFPEFLNGLDNLHEYLRFTYPNMKPPSFYCEHESRTGVTLHYRSKRRGFLHYVRGILKSLGKRLFDVDVKIEILDRENEDNMEHVILRLHFNNIDYKKKGHDTVYEELIRSQIKITSDIFFDIFPFIIVFNRGMRVRNIGLALMRLTPKLIGKKINREFVLMRPFIRFKWEELMLHSNNIFEIMSLEPIYEDDKLYIHGGEAHELVEERRRFTEEERQRFLTLKGQMIYMEEWESVCFLGIPVMENLRQMYKTGLFINDFAMHDSSRDLVLASTQQAAELKLLLNQESEKAAKMTESMSLLKAERKRTDDLLYQLLPRSVADQLRKGTSAVSTCQTFDEVTILFTDVVGFTTICSGLEPIAVVALLNDMYSAFDNLCDKHATFKVETIGDAYMVSSGAPTQTPYHAEYACDNALSIMDVIEHMHERSTGKKIQIRAGLHTGSVVAGVVGLKMPRYCLFGQTVLIANKMESTGTPMRVVISESTMVALEKHEKGLFTFELKGEFQREEGSKLKTYFLTGKNGGARDPPTPEPELMEEGEEEVAPRADAYTPVSEAAIEYPETAATPRSEMSD